MECQHCGAKTVAFEVPAAFEGHVPGSEPAVALCTRCLAMQPADATDD